MRCDWNSEYEDPCVIRMRPILEDWERKKGTLRKGDPPLDGEDRAFLTEFASGNLLGIVVRGLRGIKRAEVRKHADGSYVVDVLQDRKTSTLARVCGMEHVDFRRTTTNDMFEAYTIGGIEYARHVFRHELKQVFGAYGIKISDKHVDIVSDVVAWMGFLTKFTRHGMAMTDAKILMRASFEQSTEVLHEAARFSQRDTTKDITSAIITGRVPCVGTGKFDLLLDETALMRYCDELAARTDGDPAADHSEYVDTAPAEWIVDGVRPCSAGGPALRTDGRRFAPNTAAPFIPSSPARDIVDAMRNFDEGVIPFCPRSPRG